MFHPVSGTQVDLNLFVLRFFKHGVLFSFLELQPSEQAGHAQFNYIESFTQSMPNCMNKRLNSRKCYTDFHDNKLYCRRLILGFNKNNDQSRFSKGALTKLCTDDVGVGSYFTCRSRMGSF